MATPGAGPTKSASMFFNDTKSCKKWLEVLALTNVSQTQQAILDALRVMNRSFSFAPLEHLTCLELLRDKIAYLLAEQRRRVVGKTLPLSTGEYASWAVSRSLVAEMEEGYRRCWTLKDEGETSLDPHAALIIQRMIRYIGLQMLLAGFLYRRFDPYLWTRLHGQWLEAELHGLTAQSVKDSVGAVDGYSSVLQAYTAVVLGQLANIHELSPRQIDFVDAVMKRFGRKVSVTKDPAPNPQGLIFHVGLLSQGGAQLSFDAVAENMTRFLDTNDLSRSLRRRIKRLSDGEDPGSLDLPADWNAVDACHELQRLHLYWCDGRTLRGAANVPTEREVTLAFGISEIHFLLSGDVFAQPDVNREPSRQELNDIAMFGKVSEATIRARYAEFNYGTETWSVIDESRGALRVLRPANSSRGVAIGKLVGMKIGKDSAFYLGVIREIVDEPEGKLTVTVALLPGKPEVIAVRASDPRTRANNTYTQGFRLPSMEALKVPETLVIPSGLVPRGKGIDIFHTGHGTPKQVALYDFIERGADFDRVTLL